MPRGAAIYAACLLEAVPSLMCDSEQKHVLVSAWRVRRHLSCQQLPLQAVCHRFSSAWMKSGMDYSRVSATYTGALFEIPSIRRSNCGEPPHVYKKLDFRNEILWERGGTLRERSAVSTMQLVVYSN